MWIAMLNTKPPENNPKNAKDNPLKTKRILKPKYHLRWRSGFHI